MDVVSSQVRKYIIWRTQLLLLTGVASSHVYCICSCLLKLHYIVKKYMTRSLEYYSAVICLHGCMKDFTTDQQSTTVLMFERVKALCTG